MFTHIPSISIIFQWCFPWFPMVSHDPHLKLAVLIVVCDGIVALQGQGMESNEVLSGRFTTNQWGLDKMRWNQEKDLCFCGISMHFGREMRIRGCSLKIRPISRTWWAVVLDDVLHNVVWHSWIEWEGLVNHLVIAYSPHYDAIWHYDPTQNTPCSAARIHLAAPAIVFGDLLDINHPRWQGPGD